MLQLAGTALQGEAFTWQVQVVFALLGQQQRSLRAESLNPCRVPLSSCGCHCPAWPVAAGSVLFVCWRHMPRSMSSLVSLRPLLHGIALLVLAPLPSTALLSPVKVEFKPLQPCLISGSGGLA